MERSAGASISGVAGVQALVFTARKKRKVVTTPPNSKRTVAKLPEIEKTDCGMPKASAEKHFVRQAALPSSEPQAVNRCFEIRRVHKPDCWDQS